MIQIQDNGIRGYHPEMEGDPLLVEKGYCHYNSNGQKDFLNRIQYIRVMILPELGGRIQRAYDKTNDYDFVYYNEVIKPALVGLCGPLISGGIEFNWPQHHRPTTFSPVDYKIMKEGEIKCGYSWEIPCVKTR